MTDLGVYVYGLVAEDALQATPEVAGIDGARSVECVTQGEVSALISRVEIGQFDEPTLRARLADVEWVEQTARRHQLVLDSVLGQCTPIPMRLCTLYSSEAALRRMLDGEQRVLSDALRELRGKLEWGVQVFASRRSARDAGAGLAVGASSGTAYLSSKLAARDAGEQQDADLDQLCDQVHAELCALALACRLGAPQRPEVSAREEPMVLNAFYLVPNERSDAFRSRVAELNESGAQGIELKLTGPWAPYNFVPAVGGAQ